MPKLMQMGKCKVFIKKVKLELIYYIIIKQLKLNVNRRKTFEKIGNINLILYYHQTNNPIKCIHI